MGDPIVTLAQQRIITMSAALEAQLSAKDGHGISVEVLRRLRDRAAETMAALVTVNVWSTTGREDVAVLQNEIKKYDEWVGWLKDILDEGVAFDRDMSAEEREELLDILRASDDGTREAIALGMIDDQQTQID
jgi:hypothetical protein